MKVESLPPSSLTEQHINRWVNNPKWAAKAGTRQVALSAIRSFFGYCSARGWIVGDPSRLVAVTHEHLTHEQKEPRVMALFTTAEIDRILNVVDDEDFWRIAVRLSLESGLRLGDICQLEWSCFDMPGHIIVWTRKRNRRVALPISEELVEEIHELGVEDARYTFPPQQAMYADVKRRAHLSVQFRRICDRARVEGKSFHCLRHTFATRLRARGKTIEDIAVALGHAQTTTTNGYVH